MAWCEEQGVGYVLELAWNQRLVRDLGAELREAHSVHCRTSRPARRVWLSFSQLYPYAGVFAQVLVNLRKAPLWHPSG